MINLLILYNPYYQERVIESHLEVLKSSGKVAFGKVRSKLKNSLEVLENPLDLPSLQKELSAQKARDKNAYLQLFLTDYANLYVAKVEQILETLEFSSGIIPSYYAQKALSVDAYFIITDLREIVRNDFATLRDKYLAGFRTPDFGGHTYAIYGNSYSYPLKITQKAEVDYFSDENLQNAKADTTQQAVPKKHFLTLFKSAEFLAMQENLAHFVLGETLLYALHPNSFENLVYAELEFSANKNDTAYDFSGVVLRYAKAFEQECRAFVRTLIIELAKTDSAVLEIPYEENGHKKQVSDLLQSSTLLGVYGYLLKGELRAHIDKYAKQNPKISSVVKHLVSGIRAIQTLRNPAAHGEKSSINQASEIRNKILGIGQYSLISSIVKTRLEMQKEQQER